eukprot:4601628-Pyramimonas_sp.AAC.1
MQWRGAYEKRGLVCAPPPSTHIRAALAATFGWVLRQAMFVFSLSLSLSLSAAASWPHLALAPARPPSCWSWLGSGSIRLPPACSPSAEWWR